MNDLKSLQQRIFTLTMLLNLFEEQKLSDKYPALIPVLESLRKKLDKVNNLRLVSYKGGMSDVKKIHKRQLSKAAFNVSCGVYAYAQITGNTALKNAIHYSFSDFYRPTDTVMLGRCRQVLNAVRRIKNPSDFAIFPEIIKKLEDQLTAYINFMPVPAGEVRKHARAMRVAKTLLNQCLSILQKQLDPLMVVIGCTDQDTLYRYNISRRIDKPVGRRRKYVKSGKYKKSNKQVTPNPVAIPQMQQMEIIGN